MMKSPLNSLRKRSKSLSSNANSSKSPLAGAPEILPVRSKSRFGSKHSVSRNHGGAEDDTLEDDDRFTNEDYNANQYNDVNFNDTAVSGAGAGLGKYDGTLKPVEKTRLDSSIALSVSLTRTQPDKVAPAGENIENGSVKNEAKNAVDGVANGNADSNGKSDKGLFSGILTIVGNQLNSISTPKDNKQVDSENFNSKKPEVQPKEPAGDDSPLKTKGHNPQPSENFSIKDIHFRAVKQDSPINTLGNGNLSLSDFKLLRNSTFAKGNDSAAGSSLSPDNRYIQVPDKTVEQMSRPQQDNGTVLPLDDQHLHRKLEHLQKQQQQGIPQETPTVSGEIRTPKNERSDLLPEMRVFKASGEHAQEDRSGAISPKSTVLSYTESPNNRMVNSLRNYSDSRLEQLQLPVAQLRRPTMGTHDEENRRGKSFILSRRQQSGDTSFSRANASNLNISVPVSRSNSQAGSIKQSMLATGDELVPESSHAEEFRRKGSIRSKAPSEFSFASDRKQREFHSTFKNLPKNERLYVDYVCALSKEILLQGKLYVSENFISFNSNILGWITNVSIPLEEIVQVEKRSTAGFIPNALSIQTLHQRYLFTSFISRDSTFELITLLWNKAVRGSTPLSGQNSAYDNSDEEISASDSGYDSESGISDSDMDEVSDMDDMTSGMDDSLSSEEVLKEENKTPRTKRNRGKSGASHNAAASTYNDEGNNQNQGGSNGNNAADDNEFGGLPIYGPSKHAPTKSPWVKKSNETEIQSVSFPAPPGLIFEMLFGEKNSSFSKSLVLKQKNFDVSDIPPYEKNEETGLKERKYHYTKPLSAPVGPKQTRCNITETIEVLDPEEEGLIQILQVTHSPDVPSGNSFLVSTRFYFTWGENNSTFLQIITFIEWSGKSWIKGAIEGGAIGGQKESIEILVNAVNEELAMRLSGSGGKRKTRKKSKSKSKSKKSKPSKVDKTPSPATTNKVDNSSIFSKIYDVFDLIAAALPIPFLPKEIKCYLLIAGTLLFLGLPTVMRFLYKKDPYADIDYITSYSSGAEEYTVIPPVYKLYGNSNLRNELQINIWDWVEEKIKNEEKLENDAPKSLADDSTESTDTSDEDSHKLVDDTVGSVWRDTYYSNSLSDTQKEYMKNIMKNKRLHQLSKKYSKQELNEYIRLNEMRLKELKESVGRM